MRQAQSAKCEAQAKAFGLSKAWPTVQSICVPKISPLRGLGSKILADVTFVTEFGISRFAPNAKRKVYAEAFGLSKAWPTIQSLCVPKISSQFTVFFEAVS